MRFAVAHKTATYLMVGFAYLAMTTGGGVSPGIALGGLVLLLASWWWEPPRINYDKWSWVWTAASVFALAYCVLTAIVTGDFLGVGAQFLTWLIVAKGFNRKAARDWQQMYLLAFLMLVAGSVLNPELTYGLCFLGFVVSSTWAMTLFHLRREMEDNLLVKHAADRASERVEVRRILDSRRIVGGRFFFGTGLLSFGVFLAAAALFLALPRVGIGFFLKSRSGLTLAGFSDGVKLGGHGVIKNDSTVVMRVQIDPKFGGRSAPQIHWRGVAFDRYSKGNWTRSQRAPETKQRLEQGQVRDRRSLNYDRPAISIPEIDTLATTLVRQDIWLDPLDSDVLFGASLPRIVEYPHVVRRRGTTNERNDEIRLPHGSTIHYSVWSELVPPPPEQLRAASGPLPRGYEVYLQLDEPGKPPEITARTRAKALEITRGLTNNYDKAVAIQTWLTTNLTYTLVLEDPGIQEPVDYFLFDRKKGHCEYFASGFAILARAAGIPVRQVNGFLGGEWNEYQGYVAVRAGDAHSWDEVYFPGVGWVTFDPTPSATVDVLGRGGDGWRARLSRMMDTLRFQWTKWVIEYDLASQLELFKTVGGAIKSAALTVKAAVVSAKDAVLAYWPIGAGLGVGLIGFLVLRRRRSGPGMETGRARRTRVRSTVAEVFDQVAAALAKAGVARDAALTPRELATRMAQRGDPGAPQVGELVELYYVAEWGGRRDPAAEVRAQILAAEIRQALDAARRARRTSGATA
ncbi:MAG: transglutaminase domain protein [Myxococcales bacterium]|nr:transglutaminase domain protein [Myxococcales bacterium]